MTALQKQLLTSVTAVALMGFSASAMAQTAKPANAAKPKAKIVATTTSKAKPVVATAAAPAAAIAAVAAPAMASTYSSPSYPAASMPTAPIASAMPATPVMAPAMPTAPVYSTPSSPAAPAMPSTYSSPSYPAASMPTAPIASAMPSASMPTYTAAPANSSQNYTPSYTPTQTPTVTGCPANMVSTGGACVPTGTPTPSNCTGPTGPASCPPNHNFTPYANQPNCGVCVVTSSPTPTQTPTITSCPTGMVSMGGACVPTSSPTPPPVCGQGVFAGYPASASDNIVKTPGYTCVSTTSDNTTCYQCTMTTTCPDGSPMGGGGGFGGGGGGYGLPALYSMLPAAMMGGMPGLNGANIDEVCKKKEPKVKERDDCDKPVASVQGVFERCTNEADGNPAVEGVCKGTINISTPANPGKDAGKVTCTCSPADQGKNPDDWNGGFTCEAKDRHGNSITITNPQELQMFLNGQY